MKKIIIILILTIFLTGCSLTGKIEKKCVKEQKGVINQTLTYNIKFKKNNIYEIVKITEYSSNDETLLKNVIDSLTIQGNNNTDDNVTYEINDNVQTVTYNVKEIKKNDYFDIKKKYSDQKEFLEDMGFICK